MFSAQTLCNIYLYRTCTWKCLAERLALNNYTIQKQQQQALSTDL